MAADSDDFWTSRSRKEYQEDTFEWLHRRFLSLNQRIESQNEWQENQSKELAQSVAESLVSKLIISNDSLILSLGLIAIVALGSADLWVGVGGVVLILVWVWYRNRSTARMLWRFDRFRDDCFRELLKIAEGGGSGGMLKEDKAFVTKCRDSILFPLAVADHSRERVNADDFWKIETLYREYCSGLSHVHLAHPNPEQSLKNCELCMTVRRLREHVEGALSKFEGEVESARQTLVAQTDGGKARAVVAKDFLESYREWEHWGQSIGPEQTLISSLLKTLRDKESWTFEEADKVRELCRKGNVRWPTFESPEERSAQMFDKLTSVMATTAKRDGLEEVWQFYDFGKRWLSDGVGGKPSDDVIALYVLNLNGIRRALGRDHPEATLRELAYPSGGLRGEIFQLDRLKNYGFDREMVRREVKSGWKLIRKEDRNRKEEQRMFEAALALFWYEEQARSRAWKWS